LLETSVRERKADALLLSGGLDSSVIAYIASKYFKPIAITVALGNGLDIHYAKLVANAMKLELKVKIFDTNTALGLVPRVVKILNSYNPILVKFGVAMYVALSYAKESGFSKIMTGDGGDELFVGYSRLFILKHEELEKRVEELINTRRTSSACKTLGNYLDLEIEQPYLDQRVIEFARRIPMHLKLKKLNGDIIGKWILRKAFEELLPTEIVWRRKDKNGISRGTDKLSEIVSSTISDEEFGELSKEIKLTSREEAYYYKMMKSVASEK
jgi:asparagine synthase (glutamine-hydrolysing)